MKLVFHTECNDYEVYSSFNKIQDYLPSNFVRCHKSYIANINKIKILNLAIQFYLIRRMLATLDQNIKIIFWRY